jgi:catechol 2,3-dioxygenase-like lactoylglutathione lyase family enzyme
MSEDFTISGVEHVGITVRDMDASIAFYRDLLGLTMICDLEMDHDSSRTPGIYRGAHPRRRLVLFDTVTGPNLALNGHPGDDLGGQPIIVDDVGINHISLVTSDLEALTRHLTDAGIESRGRGWFVDPDGTLVQFEEPGHSKAALTRLLAERQSG